MANIVGGSIIWDLEVKDGGLSDGLSQAKSKIQDFSKETEKSFSKISEDMAKVGKRMSLLLTTPILAAGGASLKLAADFEQSEVAFTTMLGSADKAQDLLGDLAQFATKTPFTLKGIEDTAKQLLAMGIESDDLLPTIKSLGDVSSGLSADLGLVAYNFGQVKSQGKLTGVELRDFTRAGIPLIAELADNLNVTEGEIKDMVSAGKIGFADVEEAFITMSSEGGKFNDLMQVQSGTTTGQFSNLQDQVSLLGREIGKQLLPPAISLTKSLIKLVEGLNEINPETIKWVIGLGGALAIIGPLLIVISSVIKSIGTIAKVIKGASLAFSGLSAVLGIGIGPLLLIGVAIAVVIAVGYLLWKNWDKIMAGLSRSFENFKNILSNIWGNISQKFTDFVIMVGEIPGKIGNFFIQLPEKIAYGLGFALGTIVKWGVDTWNYFKVNVPIWITSIGDFFKALPGVIWSALVNAYNSIIKWGTDTWIYFSTEIPKWITNIVNWIASLPSRISSALSNLATTIKNNFTNTWNSIVSEVSSWPQRLLDWGRNIGNAFVNGIKDALRNLKDAFIRGFNDAKGSVQGNSPPKEGPLKDIDKWGFNVGIAWVEGLTSAMGSVKNILSDVFPNISEPAYSSAGMGSVGGSGFKQDVNINIDRIQNQSDIDALGREFGFRQSLLV